ncbi:hypothetical protein N7492_000267 [Penicillium capsulatum]|uniref:beta-glucosidase n=1 Tax=Penicillium capsulatum TaxID=69766 RepID=A0A9W9LYD8_9EURO|nr:hypothetical protein N7492_000267 [Penicillium capsulatum]KAJ6130667.1 hypothetical protein N7512_003447 [Penicillium capsulatum]
MELWQDVNAATGEHVDMNDLSLVGAQRPLIKAIVDTGVPTVVVLSSAILSIGARGNALADVLFGDYNPSGNYLNPGRFIGDSVFEASNGSLVFGHQYVLGNPQPWYPFGYGKSYSTFQYGSVRVDRSKISRSDRPIVVSVDVTNKEKKRNATEVVQAYISDDIASVMVPNRQLRGVDKVVIPAGKTKTVSIPIKVEDLGLWNARMIYVVEPRNFTVLVGSSSQDIRGNTAFLVQ